MGPLYALFAFLNLFQNHPLLLKKCLRGRTTKQPKASLAPSCYPQNTTEPCAIQNGDDKLDTSPRATTLHNLPVLMVAWRPAIEDKVTAYGSFPILDTHDG